MFSLSTSLLESPGLPWNYEVLLDILLPSLVSYRKLDQLESSLTDTSKLEVRSFAKVRIAVQELLADRLSGNTVCFLLKAL